MKSIFAISIFLFISICISAEESKRILIGVSNVKYMGDTEKHEANNNLWEVAPAYHIFKMYGFEVDFVSPKGGAVPFGMEVDQRDPPGMIAYTIKYEHFREKAEDTFKPSEINSAKYLGYFVAGGTGPLFDLSIEPHILEIAANIYENGGAVGGCGHGPGSIANVKLSNGVYLVKDKKVTGYPNSSELKSKWSKNGELLPFLVESQLRLRGGLFQTKADLQDKFDVISDQRVVTTMFLSSCAIAARKLIESVSK